MRSQTCVLFIAFLIVIFFPAAASWSQPPKVPRMTDRPLDKASYVELAKQWKQYIEENGESAEALVNLGRAHEYSKQREAALIAAQRAVEIAPDHPDALAYLAKLLGKYEHDEAGAIPLLEKCIAIEPDHEDGLISLAAIYLKSGELHKADNIFRTIFDQRIIHQPLQDFAYNMLVGLPEGAVLVTNGDADTFPALVLQAGMKFRKDVAVINRHLLQIEAYSDAIFDRYASIKPKGEIRAGKPMDTAKERLQEMVDDDDITVHFAPSVNFSDLDLSLNLVADGLTQRSSKKGLTTDEAATLFLETYRLDSATDWNFAWDLAPAVSHLLSNYVISIIRIADDVTLSEDKRSKLLTKAMEIAEFHQMERLAITIKSMQKREK